MRQSDAPGWQPRERSRASRRHRPPVGTILLLFLGFLISGLLGGILYYLPSVLTAFGATGQGVTSVTASELTNPQPGAPFTVLLLGSDDDGKFVKQAGQRPCGDYGEPAGTVLTQSLILVRVDPSTKPAHVFMFSIARDTLVDFSTGGQGKIDEVSSYGGFNATIATVQKNFKVHIDHYVWIGLKGLVNLIDRLGGIDLVTSNPVMDNEYPADLVPGNTNPCSVQRVAVLPGPQHLDGFHAMEYVRARHSDYRGDFGRSQRQQQVLMAIREKAKRVKPGDLNDLSTALKDELKTDMPLTQVGNLLPLAGSVSADSVQSLTMYGLTHPSTDGHYYEVVDSWPQLRAEIHQYFPAG